VGIRDGRLTEEVDRVVGVERGDAHGSILGVRVDTPTSRRGRRLVDSRDEAYLQEKRSDHEESVVENERKRLPGLEDAYAIAYPMLRAAMIEAEGVSAFDISDAFDARPPGVEVYFDGAHVNEVANARAARRIYESIFGADASETADAA
jgi:hypothetical protein